MVFWWVPYLAKHSRSDFNNGSGDNSNCGCILGPRHLFEFDFNNDPSTGNSSLGPDGSTSFHLNLWSPKILIIHLMSTISGPRLDLNNCSWDKLNNSRILTYWHLFVSDSINGPSPGLFNLGQMKDTKSRYRYKGINERYKVSCWVQYLAKCPRPDFNNGQGDNLNSDCILAPSIYSSLILFMASCQTIPILECGRRLP